MTRRSCKLEHGVLGLVFGVLVVGILPFCGSLPKSQFSIRLLPTWERWGMDFLKTMLPSSGHGKTSDFAKTCDFGARERTNQQAAGGTGHLSHS